jgi:hypothetical protein
MCSTGPHFKLCTCTGIESSQNYWILTTGNEHVLDGVVGLIVSPADIPEASEFDLETFITDRLLHDLNNASIFDFDYMPKVGDKICFVFDELKPEYMEEHEDYYIEVVFDGEQFDTIELGSDYKGGKEFMRGEIRVVQQHSIT